MKLPPVIRHFVLCEDVLADPANSQRISLDGLLSSIRSIDQPPYPLLMREICAYVQMTECRGVASFLVQIRHPDSGKLIFQTKTYRRNFGHDPLAVHGMSFRIKGCRFKERGLYVFEFCYNGAIEAECFLVMR